MASLSNINGLFDVHSTGAILFSTSHGTSGQILRSNGNAAPTWVAASTVIGGPYLPLTGGTLIGPLSGTSATFSGNVDASGRFRSNLGSDSGTQLNLWANSSGSTFLAGYNFAIYTGNNNARTQSFVIDHLKAATFAGKLSADNFILSGSNDNVYYGTYRAGTETREVRLVSYKATPNSKVQLGFQNGDYSFEHALTVKADLNVGIGTVSPGAKLEVSGSLFFRDFVRGYVGSSTTQYVGATWLNASDGVFYVNSGGVHKVVLDSNGDSYLNGGNVGIGETSPKTKLNITGVSGGPTVPIANSSAGIVRIESANGGVGLDIGAQGASPYSMWIQVGNTSNNTGDTYPILLNPLGGNVGIGTISPDTRLTVEGTSGHISANIRCEDGYNASIGFSDASGNWYESYIRYHTDVNDMSFAVNGSERIRITSEGNIRQYAATGGGYSQTKILPKVTPNYPGSGQSGTLENWYQPARGESGIIHYGNVNVGGGAYRCAGFIVFSAAESNSTPVAITIVPTESIGANMVAFGTASGWIQIRNTYGYAIKVMGRVESFIN